MSEVRKSMRLLFTILFLIAFACSSICISPLYAEDIEEIVVFGDSLCDTGNLYAQQAFPTSPYFDGRFSNGLVWVEYLADLMDVERPTPSIKGGTNYAWGGAETGGFGPDDYLSARGTPNIGIQINSFLYPDPSDRTTFNYPKGNQLFIVWAGANDFNNAGELPNPQDIVDNIIKHIRTLASASEPGEKLRVLIPNLPPLGQTPQIQYLGVYDPAMPWILDVLSIEFNIILHRELKKLEKELKNIIFYKLNVFSLLQKMIIDPAAFGFTNVSDTVRGTDELGCPLDVTAVLEEEKLVDNPNEYLFFDDVHPTTAAHEIIAERALEIIDDYGTRKKQRAQILRRIFIRIQGMVQRAY